MLDAKSGNRETYQGCLSQRLRRGLKLQSTMVDAHFFFALEDRAIGIFFSLLVRAGMPVCAVYSVLQTHNVNSGSLNIQVRTCEHIIIIIASRR